MVYNDDPDSILLLLHAHTLHFQGRNLFEVLVHLVERAVEA
jgi:hypothetical protein